jgi:hypothetical protein
VLDTGVVPPKRESPHAVIDPFTFLRNYQHYTGKTKIVKCYFTLFKIKLELKGNNITKILKV